MDKQDEHHFTTEMLDTFHFTSAFKPSGWECDLFGQGSIKIYPNEDKVPNAWCRFWHRFFLGSVWTLKKTKDAPKAPPHAAWMDDVCEAGKHLSEDNDHKSKNRTD